MQEPAFQQREVKAQLGLGEHLAALLFGMLAHGFANPDNSLLQAGRRGQEGILCGHGSILTMLHHIRNTP